jgi:protein gp37
MNNSKIEWTERTWNPTTGCTKVSPGCKNCYAERMSKRLQLMGKKKYEDGFKVKEHPMSLGEVDKIYWPTKIFVNSMSDLFHQDISLDFIGDVIDTIKYNSDHKFQVLTKRSERIAEITQNFDLPQNLWLGVSVELAEYKFRIDHLKESNAKIKFLSLEPLLGDLGVLDLKGIDWVIAGGESGPGARPIESAWVRSIRDQCVKQDVPFFFKQWGGKNKKRTGRHLDGELWGQFPKLLNS